MKRFCLFLFLAGCGPLDEPERPCHVVDGQRLCVVAHAAPSLADAGTEHAAPALVVP